MKILFVGFSNSIHTARWINLIKGKHENHLFPSIYTGSSHPDMNNLHIYHDFYSIRENTGKKLKITGIKYLDTVDKRNIVLHYFEALTNVLLFNIRNCINLFDKDHQTKQLIRIIKKINPDIIHSLEIQSGAYLVSRAKKTYKNGQFPPWIVSNWGSDIYFFGKDPSHAKKIREVLSRCDYYMCECERDVKLARKFGFKGTILGVLPNAGGYNVKKYAKYSRISPSKRKAIMIKGYQGWAGRALIALEAIDELGEILSKAKFNLILYSTAGNNEVEVEAKRISAKHRLKLRIIPQFTNHDKVIKLHSLARISIGLSMSDGISTSLLESMLTGSFPIQSYTACADEWLVNGHTGILVPPEDVKAVKKAILRAITDDNLVDKAKTLNLRTIKARADYDTIRKQVIQLYNTVMKEGKN